MGYAGDGLTYGIMITNHWILFHFLNERHHQPGAPKHAQETQVIGTSSFRKRPWPFHGSGSTLEAEMKSRHEMDKQGMRVKWEDPKEHIYITHKKT
jgi:hypothetical protein